MVGKSFKRTAPRYWARIALDGAIAGLAGGGMFGLWLGFANLFPSQSRLLHTNDRITLLLVTFAICILGGCVYSLSIMRFHLGVRFHLNLWEATFSGIGYGLFWWFISSAIITPILLNLHEKHNVIGSDQWLALVGYLFYGFLTAMIFNMRYWRRPNFHLLTPRPRPATEWLLRAEDAASKPASAAPPSLPATESQEAPLAKSMRKSDKFKGRDA